MFDSNAAVLPQFNSLATEQNWRSQLVDDRTDSNIFFPVRMKPLSDFLGGELVDSPDHQVVYDDSDKRIIKVHGNRYSLLTNEDAFNGINNALNKLMEAGILDPEGAHIKDSVVNKGGKVIRQYIFPKHRVDVGLGDTVMLRLLVVNSYDGSCNFQVQAGGFRLVCTNGMVTGEKFISLNARHSGQVINTAMLGDKLHGAISNFEKMGDMWHQLLHSPLSQGHADKILTELATDKHKFSADRFDMWDRLYDQHQKDMGKNYWAMYNAMTAHATHHGVSEKSRVNIDQRRLEREANVQRIMAHKVWQPKAAKPATILLG